MRGAQHIFFEQPEFERLFCHNLPQIVRFTAQILHLVGVCSACRIASQPLLACFHEVLRPLVVNALGNALTPLIEALFRLPGSGAPA
jgi:hypothetical protein